MAHVSDRLPSADGTAAASLINPLAERREHRQGLTFGCVSHTQHSRSHGA
jgi:hypothetical protein